MEGVEEGLLPRARSVEQLESTIGALTAELRALKGHFSPFPPFQKSKFLKISGKHVKSFKLAQKAEMKGLEGPHSLKEAHATNMPTGKWILLVLIALAIAVGGLWGCGKHYRVRVRNLGRKSTLHAV